MTMRATPRELLDGFPTVTIEEAMVILAVSRSKMYEMLKRDDVPLNKIGRRVMIPTSYVEELLDVDVERS